MITSTSDFVHLLKKENELLEIADPIDPNLELAEIQRRVVARRGPAVLFSRVKNTKFPVVTNLFGSQRRVDLAFGKRPERLIAEAAQFAHRLFPPKLKNFWQAKSLLWNVLKTGTRNRAHAPALAHKLENGLKGLPQIKCWPEDGGAFITLPLVYTEHPVTKISNLGMYRNQIYDASTCGMHFQILRGGGFHFHEAEREGKNLPAHIYLGGPPAFIIAAVSPLPEDIPEILLASLLHGAKVNKTVKPSLSPLPILSDADFCIVGEVVANKRRPEGPFGDHYGYYSLQHDFPVMTVSNVFHRKHAIYPATIVGRPPQEDHFIACYLQELLKPFITLVMPQVKEVWAYEESGVHSVAAAVVKDRYPREALTTALRILSEGQLALSKVLMVTDHECDVKDFKKLLRIILERIDFRKDVFILSNTSQDTLDYTGPSLNKGSKAIFLGVGEKKRGLLSRLSSPLPPPFGEAHVFCPGTLAVTGPEFKQGDGVAQALSTLDTLSPWPLVLLLDDAVAATRSPQDFLWHVFTRFEPAADVYGRKIELKRFHVELTPPLVIDCRLKPWYPKVLESDADVVRRLKPILAKYQLD